MHLRNMFANVMAGVRVSNMTEIFISWAKWAATKHVEKGWDRGFWGSKVSSTSERVYIATRELLSLFQSRPKEGIEHMGEENYERKAATRRSDDPALFKGHVLRHAKQAVMMKLALKDRSMLCECHSPVECKR